MDKLVKKTQDEVMKKEKVKHIVDVEIRSAVALKESDVVTYAESIRPNSILMWMWCST